MDSVPKRPWYRLHWLTWLVLVLLVVGLDDWEREERLIATSGFANFTLTGFGWPIEHGRLFGKHVAFPKLERSAAECSWDMLALATNSIVCVLLVLSTAVIVERCLRSPNRLQLSLRSLMAITAITGIMLCIAVQSETLEAAILWMTKMDSHILSADDLSWPPHWPVLFALGCTIYSLGWLVCFAVLRIWSLVRRRPT